MDRRSFLTTAAKATGAGTAHSSELIAASPQQGGPAASKQSGSALNPQVASLHQRVLAERKGSLKGKPEPVALPRLVLAGLDPYVPSPEKPWDKQRAGYLLRRSMFGAKREDIDMAMTKSPGEVVDMLLADQPAPNPPGSWINDDYYYDNTNNDRDNKTWMRDTRYWWAGLMLGQDFSIREKLTLFWHDHWATQALTVRQPHFNYWFVNFFRTNTLGNFKQMVKDVTISPAMLIFLDGWYNKRQRPNENYARELMELHTLGEGIGYAEEDIHEASRALTGWTIQKTGTSPVGTNTYHPTDAVFIANNFDDTEKTFLGQTGNWGYEDVVNIIFEQRELEVATHICRKLYREFVYEIADETIIAQMSSQLISGGWELKPVIERILKSEHFFETANIGAHITSPQEFYIGSIRSLDIETDNHKYLYEVGAVLGLQLLEAPGVEGWPAYRNWISASRLASRWAVSDEIVFGNMRSNPKFGVDAIEYVSGMSEPNNARQLIQDVIDYLVPLTLSENQFEILLDKLLAGAPEYEWNITLPGAEGHVKDLLKAVLRLSESQLC